jgi:hypothetical protein
MELRLTDKEHELLLELLDEQQKHLLHQINKADHREYKMTLRARCTTLEGILQRLKEAMPVDI